LLPFSDRTIASGDSPATAAAVRERCAECRLCRRGSALPHARKDSGRRIFDLCGLRRKTPDNTAIEATSCSAGSRPGSNASGAAHAPYAFRLQIDTQTCPSLAVRGHGLPRGRHDRRYLRCVETWTDARVSFSRQSKLTRRRVAAVASATLLTRCAALPQVEGPAGRDIGLTRREPTRGGSGTPSPPVDDVAALQQQYDLQLALSESPLVFGNKVTLLPGGAKAIEAIFQALAQARNSINLEYFILADVVSDGTRLSEVLLDRLRAGVRINIIYDSYGSRDTPSLFFDGLRQAGARIIEFNPLDPLAGRTPWSPNDRDHRKIAVVDGRVGFTGGVNLDHAYENPPEAGVPSDGDARHSFWRDVAVRIEGPAVAELQKLFFGTWREQKGPPVEQADYFPPLPRQGVQTIRIIGSSPGERQPLYYASLLAAMKSARQRIWLCSGYFVPPLQEREELYAAGRAGIDVRVVAPAFSDVQSAVYASRAAYGDLLESGAKVFEMRDSVLHAKIAVVDDTWTVVGSSNLDRRSVVFNNEVDAVILGHDAVAQVEGVIREYMAVARPVALATWKNRTLRERVREMEARVWQYWM
jgi:cardiolipin synthase